VKHHTHTFGFGAATRVSLRGTSPRGYPETVEPAGARRFDIDKSDGATRRGQYRVRGSSRFAVVKNDGRVERTLRWQQRRRLILIRRRRQ
jgi:hypothetical protein